MVSEAAASVPLLLYEGPHEIEQHPLLDLIARPNPVSSAPDLLESWYGFLLVSGNAYLEAVALDGSLRELHALRPDRMKVIPGPEGWPEAFEYTAAGRSVRFASEVVPGVRPILHVKLFNPVNDHYGLSPIEAAATAIDIHNTASKWNKALLDNSARPSGALVYTSRDGNLSPEQFERLKAELEQGFQGAAHAGRPLLLEGGLDWKSMSLSPKDMDFIEAKHVAAREIALALGVPPMLLGIPGDNTYSNYQEATRTFWRYTVLPLVTRTAKALSTWLSPAYGGVRPSGSDTMAPPLELRPDLDAIEALNPEREALWARLEKATFLTPNEKRAAVGYGSIVRGDEIKSLREGLEVDASNNLSYKYPGQPRNPLGQFDFGKNPDAAQPAQDRRGFLIDLTQHEGPIGDTGAEGHTIRDHVGRTTASMIAQMGRDMESDGYGGISYRRFLGSFSSVAAAQRLIASTLSANTATVDRVIAGSYSNENVAVWMPLDSVTGVQAYRASPSSQIEIRDTSQVTVVIRREPSMSDGFRIVTAYPTNTPPRNLRAPPRAR